MDLKRNVVHPRPDVMNDPELVAARKASAEAAKTWWRPIRMSRAAKRHAQAMMNAQRRADERVHDRERSNL